MPTEIKTREELLMALTEAAELEHGLACQYLFTLFSLKLANEGLTTQQMTMVNGWRRDLAKIAKQEMAHLGTVTNLLSVIGGAPHFRRPNFPQPPKFYSPDIAFSLERLGEPSLTRYVKFEQNEQASGPEVAGAPEEIPYQHVGELYAAIIKAFETLPEAELFINKPSQDDQLAGGAVHPERATTRTEAVDALTRLMVEGEAYVPPVAWSHYQAFFKMLHELKTEVAAQPTFDPARNVLTNPLTRRHRDVTGGNLITNLQTRAAVERFNCLYTSMILVFEQYYSFGGETAEQREVLRNSLMRFMQEVIKPLGMVLTKLPALEGEADGPRAGGSFEFYGQYRLSPIPKVAWSVIIEKLTKEIADAADLGGDPIFASVATTVTEIRDSLKASLPN